MKKLNKRKIRWIVREVSKREMGVYSIAKQQSITPRWAREVHRKYKGVKDPVLLPCGRKPREISKEERQLVTKTYKEYRLGACNLQAILDEKGMHIPHNKIHRILREEGIAKPDEKKQKRRKWIRFERKHSLSLISSDWFEYKGWQIVLFEDDASRFITGYGKFKQATAENTIKVLKQSLKYGKPKQVHTDHGPQYVANEQEGKKTGTSKFTELLHELGIQHIKARIKHPQANGKVERLIGTIKRLWNELGSLDKAVRHYNYKRPHMSLENGKLRIPYQAFLEKARKAK